MTNITPTMLIIRDGWGENHHSEQDAYNAIKLANIPVSRKLSATHPRTEIMACGLDVGLPDGIMGNSEVGHENIGAGRIVDQEIVRLDKGFSSGIFEKSPALTGAIANAKAKGSALHLMGLCSDAGVHAMLNHLYALMKIAKKNGIEKLFIHSFMDGRDTPPKSGVGFIRELEAKIKEIGIGKIASVCGRFWCMDRDNRWDRVSKAYYMLTGQKADFTALSAEAAVQHYYDNPLDEQRTGDEFVLPSWVVDASGKPVGCMKDGDSVVFFNYRGDRPRELTRAFIEDNFKEFERGKKLDLFYATLAEYQKGLCPNVISPKPEKLKNTLGIYVASKGLKQFRCAETEKFPHVTFFFNNYREEPFEGEDRTVVPSPKDVATYDQKPEMSAYGVCETVLKAIESQKYTLIVVNFANPDMVGHTGSIPAAVKACEVVDECIGKLLAAAEKTGMRYVVTADHGNSDQMFDPTTGGPFTAHTLNPVEVVIGGKGTENMKMRQKPVGRLGDLAPTILELMGLPKPEEMTGESLIQH